MTEAEAIRLFKCLSDKSYSVKPGKPKVDDNYIVA